MKDNSSIKEKALNPLESSARSGNLAVAETEPLDTRIITALRAADDKKGHDLVVLDLRGIATFTDYFVITSGANQRQVQAISDAVSEKLKQAGTRAARIEGYRTAEWILLDYGDFIFHIFDDKARGFYDLERLWREGKRVELPPELAHRTVGSLRNGS